MTTTTTTTKHVSVTYLRPPVYHHIIILTIRSEDLRIGIEDLNTTNLIDSFISISSSATQLTFRSSLTA